MNNDYTKCPRLYVPDDLSPHSDISLSRDHVHYLLNVMRKQDGDTIRVFNGHDGEYSGKIAIQGKKDIQLKWLEIIKDQTKPSRKIHLYCPPIKKDRFAFMIEKSVELGVTDVHPITTNRTQNAKINTDKITRYIIEATEQCERMDIPTLHPIQTINDCHFDTQSYCAIERQDNLIFRPATTNDVSIIIGPEGGWTDDEIDYLSHHKNIQVVSLGDSILRAETAAIFMLSRIG